MMKKDGSRWLYHIRQWHWISSAISLVGLLLFAVTGITLNRADLIKSQAEIIHWEKDLPADLPALTAEQQRQKQLPPSWRAWLTRETDYRISHQVSEWDDGEIYLALPSPGADAWVSIDSESRRVTFEARHRGAIAFLNDLHKGRHTGEVWRWFMDIFALACVVFSVTGLFLLIYYQKQRKTTWAVAGTGLVIPVVLILLFIHV